MSSRAQIETQAGENCYWREEVGGDAEGWVDMVAGTLCKFSSEA